MADLVLLDARMEMPELFIPAQKPYGNVIIDWSHPMSYQLQHAFLPPFSRHDLVTGVVAKMPTTSVVKYGVPAIDAGANTNNSRAMSGFFADTFTATAVLISSSTSEKAISGSFNTGTTQGYVLSINYTAANKIRFFYRTTAGSSYDALIDVGAAGFDLNDGKPHTLVITTSTGKTVFYAHIDGKYAATGSVGGKLTGFTTWGYIPYIAANNGRGTIQNPVSPGGLAAFFLHADIVSDPASFSRNPYQILIPA